ncbi:hypothetical protein SASPL_112619 [Salvia splendens]|uniref:Uncharacterized protein n=1 Tax=Salvia splendens TaxID=180675 RepID=A0A8X9A4R9_SALSN|nr:hypothetical protein SASPL_112619 [Salvia splendens]
MKTTKSPRWRMTTRRQVNPAWKARGLDVKLNPSIISEIMFFGWVHLTVSICDTLRTCFAVEGKRREIELVVDTLKSFEPIRPNSSKRQNFQFQHRSDFCRYIVTPSLSYKVNSHNYSLLPSKFVTDEVLGLVLEDSSWVSDGWRFNGAFHDQNWFLYDKVAVLESEKRAWESSPEAQAMRDALNPWRHQEKEAEKSS